MVSSSGERGHVVYAFCAKPAAIKHGSTDSHGRHCHGKVCWLCRTFYLRRRSACMIWDESMALLTQRNTHLLSKPRVDP